MKLVISTIIVDGTDPMAFNLSCIHLGRFLIVIALYLSRNTFHHACYSEMLTLQAGGYCLALKAFREGLALAAIPYFS